MSYFSDLVIRGSTLLPVVIKKKKIKSSCRLLDLGIDSTELFFSFSILVITGVCNFVQGKL